MMSCSIWFSGPSFWMGDGLESRCVGRVYGPDGVDAPDGGCMYTKCVELRIHR